MAQHRVKANYEKRPVISVPDQEQQAWFGWESIKAKLSQAILNKEKKKVIVAIECYTGVNLSELHSHLDNIQPNVVVIKSEDVFKSVEEIDAMVLPDVTEDPVFGYLTRLCVDDFFDQKKVNKAKEQIERAPGITIVLGTGASKLCEPDVLVYADMPRWEGQLRYRRNEASNMGADNASLSGSLQYKRAYFVDWRVCDRLKKSLFEKWDFYLDTVIPDSPKMATGASILKGLKHCLTRPFRVVPFFDPGPWGGQWMKEVCDLDRSQINYAWCFDCVPEENSLILDINGVEIEVPSINLVFYQPSQFMGERVHARFGDEFPIRFDFLDTMEGGNLSLQVHPLTEYIQTHFGMHYTQDESYYILDASEGAFVYLGLKENIIPTDLINDLEKSGSLGVFDAEKYVEKWPVKKHNHVLIPAGTIHCSGKDSMVLEISATPYIFTFKLWDWGRLGLDGKPRPININRGKENIQWERTTSWTRNNLINRIEKIAEGDGWLEERTGLHHTEFIETRRHWFTKTVTHHTDGLVNVLNLIEGEEAIIESPLNAFEPYIVHYAETFIVPANVGEYTITPHGAAAGTQCGTIKAFVRTNP
ncbi:MAG TPA: class I mannose-6-phosphate isomerase [Pedobacter sp.]